jgi:hypothetical protein
VAGLFFDGALHVLDDGSDERDPVPDRIRYLIASLRGPLPPELRGAYTQPLGFNARIDPVIVELSWLAPRSVPHLLPLLGSKRPARRVWPGGKAMSVGQVVRYLLCQLHAFYKAPSSPAPGAIGSWNAQPHWTRAQFQRWWKALSRHPFVPTLPGAWKRWKSVGSTKRSGETAPD